ncbi:MAG TPA: HAD-IIA family hydrolase [Actinomycetales bacterium]|nr:HAD-IIA family hydrolase [Actinomycetales bacterium]
MPDGSDAAAPLAIRYDAALLDLDGVVYSGDLAVPGAAEALGQVRRLGMARVFVTNNASRTPAAVVEHLERLNVPARPLDVVTSAQAAAARLEALLAPGARVLVVGGEGLVHAVCDAGFEPVRSAQDDPRAVVQGFSPDLTWQLLMEACVAVRAGLPWIATNVDATLPTPRGEGPGNGAMVDVVRRVTRRDPDAVAGKPFAPIMEEACRRVRSTRPLVVGDRLDTDIEAAQAAGMDSLLVLTGVTGVRELLTCPAGRRPTYVGPDLTALLSPGHRAEKESAGEDDVSEHGAAPDGSRWRCGVASVRLEQAPDGTFTLDVRLDGASSIPSRSDVPPATAADVVHAAAAACWAVVDGRTDADGGSAVPEALVAELVLALSPWAARLGWDR